MKRIVCILISLVIFSLSINASALSTSAAAAVLINGDTGEIIYQQNSDAKLPMASTTKIMTALLLCEYGHFDDEITVTADMLRVEGSSMGLLAGDKVTLHDLLYGMMLASGNDAANVTAIVIGGSVKGFVKMMNDKAKEIGLKSTSFVTPSGLDDENHYTTAYELALIAKYALQNEEFAKAAGSKSAVLNYGNPPYRRSLTNHNRLLKYFDGAVGVKTGFTKKSGRCLVTAAKRDGKYVIAVTLHDPNDWKDHEVMLEEGLASIKQTVVNSCAGEYYIPTVGSKAESVSVKLDPYTINSLSESEITCTVKLPKFVYAPINQGEPIGYAEYTRDGVVLKRVELCAESEIKATIQEKKTYQKILDNIKYLFKNI